MVIVKQKFGWTSVNLPIIGQGTWMIENSGNRSSNFLAIKALQSGLDLGMLHIDTAEMYGNGKAEELVGQSIEGRIVVMFSSWILIEGKVLANGFISFPRSDYHVNSPIYLRVPWAVQSKGLCCCRCEIST